MGYPSGLHGVVRVLIDVLHDEIAVGSEGRIGQVFEEAVVYAAELGQIRPEADDPASAVEDGIASDLLRGRGIREMSFDYFRAE